MKKKRTKNKQHKNKVFENQLKIYIFNKYELSNIIAYIGMSNRITQKYRGICAVSTITGIIIYLKYNYGFRITTNILSPYKNTL